MEYIKLTKENLQQEHICCAISSDKDPQVISKKGWLAQRMDEGLVFLRAAERGKCFIEYIPAEHAWVPIEAQGYMHINCLWVSGAFKGHGYANDLLQCAIEDAKAKGKRGLTVISSSKKMPFLSDPKYLAHKGFHVADTAEPCFTLMVLPFSKDVGEPKFKACARQPIAEENGFTLYYTSGCPFTAKYVPLVENVARENDIPFRRIHIDNREKAQNAPVAWTNYALFYEGKYVTNEILSEKKFLALAQKMMR